jgi:fused signal recognition particle receptor
MANKGKFLSWFGKGKKKQEQETDNTAVESAVIESSAVESAVAESTVVDSTVVESTVVESAVVESAAVQTQITPAQPTVVKLEPVALEVSANADTVPATVPAMTEAIPGPVEEQPKEKEGFFARFKKEAKVSPEPKNSPEPQSSPELDNSPELENSPESGSTPEQEEKQGFFARLKKGLSKTKINLGSGLVSLLRGKKIDDELFEDLETQLLVADVGVDTTLKLVASLTKHADRKQLKDAEALYDLLKQEMMDLLKGVDEPLVPHNPDGPFVLLMVGVNGVGKTTTIGKMAKQFQSQGKSVLLAAGDTFRAAAVEQLTVWGERNNIPVIAQHTGADSASVIFDAIQAAKARNVDVIIADTAGRLQNKEHLMDELKKVVRVMKKLDVAAPHEVMLTLDAGTGQNALSQVKLFSEAVGLTGLTVSKLDGTAKGGVVFAIADQFSVPIRYIGVGEGIDDLRPFNSKDFVDALFAQDDHQVD